VTDQQAPYEPGDPDRSARRPPERHTDEQRWDAVWSQFGQPEPAGAAAPPPPDPWARPPGSWDSAQQGQWDEAGQWHPWPPAAPPTWDRGPAAPPPTWDGGAAAYDAGPSAQYSAYDAVPSGRPPGPDPAGATAADLASATLLRPREQVPTRGWRRAVLKATGGTVNPGPSAQEKYHAQLVQQIRTPVRGRHRIAVVSLKGGIGKTTTAACLGLTLAHYRGDRVVAIDANPDAGTLAERLTGDVTVTVSQLLRALPTITSYTDVSAYTHLAGRLQVVASEQDPEMSHAFDEEQYRAVVAVLERYFNLIVTDSGTGLLHSAMAGTLALADSLVIVGAPSIDGSSRAAKTLDWLVAHGLGDLVARSVAVVNTVRPATRELDLGAVRQHFALRCRTVVEIPYDPHLVTGGRIASSDLRGRTAEAYLELAAAVAAGFALGR